MFAIMNIVALGLLIGALLGAVPWGVTGAAIVVMAAISIGIGWIRGRTGRQSIAP